MHFDFWMTFSALDNMFNISLTQFIQYIRGSIMWHHQQNQINTICEEQTGSSGEGLMSWLNSLPSRITQSSPCRSIPHLTAMLRAVLMLSPVTMRTVIPERWHLRMASGTYERDTVSVSKLTCAPCHWYRSVSTAGRTAKHCDERVSVGLCMQTQEPYIWTSPNFYACCLWLWWRCNKLRTTSFVDYWHVLPYWAVWHRRYAMG